MTLYKCRCHEFHETYIFTVSCIEHKFRWFCYPEIITNLTTLLCIGLQVLKKQVLLKRCSGFLRCVVLWVCPDVSEELAASIFTVIELSSRKPKHQDNTK